MTDVPEISLSHAGFHVFDMDRMVEFFTAVLGFQVSDRGKFGGTEVCFLSSDPKDHHQLVLYGGRTEDTARDDSIHFNHVSFRVRTLDMLRQIYAKVQDYPGITRVETITHGNAWSVYFFDPEGNRTEAFMDTPWHVSQPFGVPLDLSLPDEKIYADTEALLRDNPTARPFEDWRRALREKLESR